MMNRDKTTPVVIYHKDCADGFAAALAFWLKYPDWEYVAASYAAPFESIPEGVDGRVVYLLDFCYKLDKIEELAKRAKHVIILDHHQTAEEGLRGHEWPNVTKKFFMNMSGCGIAWEYVHPELPIPYMFERLQARDIWQLDRYDDVKEVDAAVTSYPFDFELWKTLLELPDGVLAEQGRPVMRKQLRDINQLIGNSAHRMTVAGFDVPCLNAPYFMASDAGAIMAVGEPFAVVYSDGSDMRRVSLRSALDGEDVAKIAEQFGGGGHKHAAAFRVQHQWKGD